MSNLQFSIWGEISSLENVFQGLVKDSADVSVIKELAKAILLQRNLEKYKISAIEDQALIGTLFNQFLQATNLSSPEKLEQFLQKTKQKKETIIGSLLYRERVERLKTAVISTEKLTEAFVLNKSRFEKISFAIIQVDSEGLVTEIYHRIKDDKEDFSKLAKEFSLGEEASLGGIIPPQAQNSIKPEIKRRLTILKPGEISEPFLFEPNVFAIVKLIEIESLSLTPQIERSLRDDLFNKWVSDELIAAEPRLLEVET